MFPHWHCFFFILWTTKNRIIQNDPEFNAIVGNKLLDNTAAKHKLSIKPRKAHMSSFQRSISPQLNAKSGDADVPKEQKPIDIEKYVSKSNRYAFYNRISRSS